MTWLELLTNPELPTSRKRVPLLLSHLPKLSTVPEGAELICTAFVLPVCWPMRPDSVRFDPAKRSAIGFSVIVNVFSALANGVSCPMIATANEGSDARTRRLLMSDFLQ
eukprot:169035-Rhodomonas_salina.1